MFYFFYSLFFNPFSSTMGRTHHFRTPSMAPRITHTTARYAQDRILVNWHQHKVNTGRIKIMRAQMKNNAQQTAINVQQVRMTRDSKVVDYFTKFTRSLVKKNRFYAREIERLSGPVEQVLIHDARKCWQIVQLYKSQQSAARKKEVGSAAHMLARLALGKSAS